MSTTLKTIAHDAPAPAQQDGVTIVRTSETPRVQVPTWAALKTAYKSAESSGVKARSKAYDTIVRAYALTDATETDSKSGAVKARSERSRAGEVVDALSISSGNTFGLSVIRIAQVVKVYAATAKAGADPFSAEGRALFTALDTIRKFDADALNKAATAHKGASAEAKAEVLSKAVEAAKTAAKERTAANKGTAGKTVAVKSLADVTAFATGALSVVREASATASADDKAALKAALEAMIAHLA